MRNWEEIGFRAHKSCGFEIMRPNAQLFPELGSILLLLGANRFGNQDIVNAYSLTHSLTHSLAGWLAGWMDGWMDEWMDGWMAGWMDRWMNG